MACPLRRCFTINDTMVLLPGEHKWVVLEFDDGAAMPPTWMSARALGDAVRSLPVAHVYLADTSPTRGEKMKRVERFHAVVVDDLPWLPAERTRIAELEAEGLASAAAERLVLEYGTRDTWGAEARRALEDALDAGAAGTETG